MPRCSILFSQLLGTATQRIWIASPYFVPDQAMTRCLQAAAKRDVDVRVIVPELVGRARAAARRAARHNGHRADGISSARWIPPPEKFAW